MQDKKKIEADEPVFGLASVDLVEVEAPTWHIAEHLPAIRYPSHFMPDNRNSQKSLYC